MKNLHYIILKDKEEIKNSVRWCKYTSGVEMKVFSEYLVEVRTDTTVQRYTTKNQAEKISHWACGLEISYFRFEVPCSSDAVAYAFSRLRGKGFLGFDYLGHDLLKEYRDSGGRLFAKFITERVEQLNKEADNGY